MMRLEPNQPAKCNKQWPLYIKLGALSVFAALLSWGCANRGSGPQGGPIDSIPPIMVKSFPQQNQTNVESKKIVIDFNEIVLLEEAAQKVVVSPPQSTQPIVKAVSHKIYVDLPDSLEKNTTYTIDFADAIVDNNEKNKLNHFSLSFSTGDVIDSLQMRGHVLNAENLSPVSGMTIGIHRDLSDSAFLTKPFDRITKSDDQGRFTVRNISPGSYRIFGLNDIGNNYKYDQPNEMIAFQDTVYVPQIEHSVKPDTVWKEELYGPDSVLPPTPRREVDSIIYRGSRNYQPRSILLKAFTNNVKRQYLTRQERTKPYRIDVIMNTTTDSLPRLTPVNYQTNLLMQVNGNRDTISYWLTDSMAFKLDTLVSALTYRKTDSLGVVQWQTDTINSIYRTKKHVEKGKRNKPQNNILNFLSIKTNISNKFDIYSPIVINFEVPTQITDSNPFTLEQKVDSTWKAVPIELEKADSIGLSYRIVRDWTPEVTYRLSADSATIENLYGEHNNKFVQPFTIRAIEEYSKLILNLSPYSGKEVIEILNNKDEVIRRVKPESKRIDVEYLEPGEIYMRLFIDENGNGVWDTGDYSKNLQPELVYYFPYKIPLRAYWDIEEDWNYRELPVLEQKPDELLDTKQNKK